MNSGLQECGNAGTCHIVSSSTFIKKVKDLLFEPPVARPTAFNLAWPPFELAGGSDYHKGVQMGRVSITCFAISLCRLVDENVAEFVVNADKAELSI